jgi:serine/threonine protein phosphatase PrpC
MDRPPQALKDSLRGADRALREDARVQTLAVSSGTTACVALVHRKNLWIGFCGDSGAVLGSRTLRGIEANKLTREHTPTDLAERSRCIRLGAHVSQPTEPGLTDARSPSVEKFPTA